MTQWPIDPRFLCRKHLLGEHVEHHMMVGSLRAGRIEAFLGHVKRGQIAPRTIYARHQALSLELCARKYNHRSRIDYREVSQLIKILPRWAWWHHKPLSESRLLDLLNRCPECKARWEDGMGRR